jgi:hypothetical protein
MHPVRTSENLDYAEMISLAEALGRWAITSLSLSPSARTELIQWSSDLERIAAWCGPKWRAPYPSCPETILKATARKLLYEDGARERSMDRFFRVSEWRW